MSVYRLQRCRSCHYKRRHNKSSSSCPKCHGALHISKNFYFDYYLNGQKHTKSAGPDKKEAQEALWKKKISISEGRACIPTSWKSGVEELEGTFPNLSSKTVEMYRNCVANLSMSFSSMKLPDITGQHLKIYKEERLSMGASASSFNRERSTLKRIFSLCGVAWRFKKSIFTSEPEEPRTRFLDEMERDRLMSACKKRDLLFSVILVALDTGMRKTPILNLQWRDISFKENLITKEGKGGKVHRVPMTGRLREHLIKYRSKQKVLSMWVFPGSDIGKPITDIRKSFSTACKEAGVPDIRFHDLRRSFASHFLMTTKDLSLTQDMLGHADISTTRRVYGHLLDEHKRSGMQIFEEATR
jgi:integrase